MGKTLYINGEKILDWIFEHEVLTEDFLNYFDPNREYTRIEVGASDFYPIEEN